MTHQTQWRDNENIIRSNMSRWATSHYTNMFLIPTSLRSTCFQLVEQAVTVSPHGRRHPPCWSRRSQMSWTWGWTAGRWLARCAFHPTAPPSFRSLRSTHGSFRPLSLESKDIGVVTKEQKRLIFNTVTYCLVFLLVQCILWTINNLLVSVKISSLLELYCCKLWKSSKI